MNPIKFLLSVQRNLIVCPHWRTGQAMFNTLCAVDVKLTGSIRGSKNDPFHDDRKIPDFLVLVFTAWEIDKLAKERRKKK